MSEFDALPEYHFTAVLIVILVNVAKVAQDRQKSYPHCAKDSDSGP